MKTHLVAVDLSDASTVVMHTASSFARQLGARLEIIHVVEPMVTTVPIGAAMDVIEVAPPSTTHEDLEFQTRELNRRVGPMLSGVEFSASAVIGMAADEIVERAASAGADFIVMGSHGHGAIYHLFAGSVVTGVLKRAQTPVLVVPVGKK